MLLILFALLTLFARVGLPMVSAYKGHIESRVSDYLRSPVDIGKLSLSWEGLGPILRAQQVAVYESVERQVTLDELLIDLNLAKSLLRGIPVINELTLVGASLAIEADDQGQLRLHGMQSVAAGPAPGKTIAPKGVDIVSWLLAARKVGLLDTQVTFIDKRADRRLVVQDLNIRAENIGDVHKLRVDLRLPDELGGSLEAGIDLQGQANDLANSDGNVYVKVDSLQVQALSELLSLSQLFDVNRNLISHIDTGVSAEMWGQWKDGQLVSARGPVSTSAIVDTVSNEKVLDELSAVLAINTDNDVSSLRVSDINLSLDGDAATIDQIELSGVSSETDSAWPALQASGKELPVELLSRLPLSLLARIKPSLAAQLVDASLQGRLLDWKVSVAQGPDDLSASPSISMTADLSNVQSHAVGLVPGIGPINGRIDIVDSSGSLSIETEDMPLVWPAFTDRSLDVDSIKAVIDIDASNLQRVLLDGDFTLLDEGIDTSTRIKASLVPGQSPHLDIQSRYSAENIAAIKTWLPRNLMPLAAVEWLDSAIEGGGAKNGSLLFFGNLTDFPFDEGEGVFRASVDVAQGRLAFLPEWPSVSGIDGTIELSGLRLSGRADSARLADFDISQASFSFDNLFFPVLRLNGTASGVLQQIVDFANKGPLEEFLEPVLNDVTATGAAQMDLALIVPLYKKPASFSGEQASLNTDDSPVPVISKSKWLPLAIDGSIFLSGNDLSFERAQMGLTQVTGAIGFNQYGIRINNLRALMLGQRITVDGKTTGEGSAGQTRISINGAMKARDVLANYESPLEQFFTGTSNWTVDVLVPHSNERIAEQGVAMTFSSDLVGTELLLPAPMGKSTAKAGQLVLEAAFFDESGEQQWNLNYADNLRVHAKVESTELHSLFINLGGKEIEQSVIDSNTAGIHVQGSVASMAADGWVDSISRFIDAASDPDADPEPFPPITSELSIDSLILGSQSLGSAKLRVNSDPIFLNLAIANQAIQGSLRYPRVHWKKDVPLKARLKYVDWSVIDALSSESLTKNLADDTAALDPRLLPPIDAHIGAITRNSLTFKDVVVRAQPDVSGLSVTTLGFAYKTMQLVGQGYWRLKDPQGVSADLVGEHMTQLNMVLQSDDFGTGFEQVGLTDVLADGQGTIEMQVSWPGPAYKPELAQLDGQIKLLLERGSIIPLEPAGGRLVGLFALQALPRRLELDFKDLTGDGLAFKRISGDISIEDGIAKASLIQLTGPIGVVDIWGSSDLNTRQLDQRVTILPRVSAALPIIGAISGGASAGIGVLVAAGFLKALGIDFDRIGLRDYTLTGNWNEPEFKSIRPDYGRRR